jgi:hypothetical protein
MVVVVDDEDDDDDERKLFKIKNYQDSSFQNISSRIVFLGAKSTSIRDCVGPSVGWSVRPSVRPSPTMRDYVEN